MTRKSKIDVVFIEATRAPPLMAGVPRLLCLSLAYGFHFHCKIAIICLAPNVFVSQ